MPVVLNKPIEKSPWSNPPPGAPTPFGEQRYRQRDGYRHISGENRTKPLQYYGWHTRGTLVSSSDFLPYNGSYQPSGRWGDNPYTGNSGWVSGEPPWLAILKNRAYDKFKQKALGESSALGVLLAERKEAFGMVANRVIHLHQAYRRLRRGDFRGFLRNLSVDPRRKHRSVVRTAASEASGLWLEYWFGWSPTVQDLYSIGKVLSNTEPEGYYTGWASTKLTPISATRGATNTFRTQTEWGKAAVKMGAKVRLTNPNLQLMASLGLVNPAVIAWEVVPFSFVIDWFTKFGNVLEGFSDFVGCEIEDPWWTQYANTELVYETGDRRPSYWRGKYHYRIHRIKRSKGLLKPVATLPSFVNVGRSKTRAATAVSLLTQLFLSK